MRRVLVAGIGNIFLGDDGWGVEVANRLLQLPMPDGVRVADFGIRGMHLAYELLDGYDTLVIVDAMAMGEPPGTVALVEPDRPDPSRLGEPSEPMMDAHSMNPGIVLGLLDHLEARVDRVLVVGCEPANLDEGIGLSPTALEAVDVGVAFCRQLITEITAPVAKETTR